MSLDARHDAAAAELAQRHDFLGARHKANERRTLWVVALTAIMMVGEIVAGLAFNSMALLADGIHMATHAGALGVAAGAYMFARKYADDPRFSFGTGKVGDLAGFGSAVALGIFALGIAAESVSRFFENPSIAFTEAIVVAVLGLIVNIVSAVMLADHHGHSHGDHGHSHSDNNLRSAFVHVLADALTSVLAIAALVSGLLLGWVWLDPVMGLVGAAVISVWAVGLMRDTGRVLLDRTATDLAVTVRNEVRAEPEAIIADLHVWRLGPGAHAVVLCVAGSRNAEDLRERLRALPGVAHLTVESRPVESGQA